MRSVLHAWCAVVLVGLPLRESYDKAVVSLIDALGLRPFFERLANWLARHLPGGRS